MPEKPFKVNVYKVVVENDDENQLRLVDNSLDEAISAACASSLNDKNRRANEKRCRLEHDSRQDHCFLLNFAVAAFDGPGHFRHETQVVPFGLQEGEAFAHETAMLYDPENKLVLLESSQRGMTRVSVARYFMTFALPKTRFELVPVLDDEAASRARRYKTVRSLSMKVALPAFTNVDRDAGVGAIQALGERFGAGSIDLTINAEPKRKSLFLDKLWEATDFILGQGDSESISNLTIDGREFDEDSFSVIDLIQHREKRTRMLEVDSKERKVPHTERWSALVQIRKEFLS